MLNLDIPENMLWLLHSIKFVAIIIITVLFVLAILRYRKTKVKLVLNLAFVMLFYGTTIMISYFGHFPDINLVLINAILYFSMILAGSAFLNFLLTIFYDFELKRQRIIMVLYITASMIIIAIIMVSPPGNDVTKVLEIIIMGMTVIPLMVSLLQTNKIRKRVKDKESFRLNSILYATIWLIIEIFLFMINNIVISTPEAVSWISPLGWLCSSIASYFLYHGYVKKRD